MRSLTLQSVGIIALSMTAFALVFVTQTVGVGAVGVGSSSPKTSRPVAALQNITTGATTPEIPSADASVAQWQSFATLWNSSLGSTSLSSFQGADINGCTVVGAAAVAPGPGADAAAGIPAGVMVDGLSIQLDCGSASSLSHAHVLGTSSTIGEGRSVVAPLTAPQAGSECENVGGLIKYGIQCTYTCTVNGDSAACTYFYNESAAFEQHVELSADGAGAMTCSVGSLMDKSSTYSIATDAYNIVSYPVETSNVYNGNDWEPASSPYTNLGNACAGF